MGMIKRLMHLIPFVHFYKPWNDVGAYGGYHKQHRYCSICNKVQNRLESFGYADE